MPGKFVYESRTIMWAILVAIFVTAGQVSSTSLPTLKQYLDALNAARLTPKDMATFITSDFKDKVPSGSQAHSEWGVSFMETCPGVFDEAITYLNAYSFTSSAQEIDLGLTYAAWKHAKWLVEENAGTLSAVGASGTTFTARMKEYTDETSFTAAQILLATGSTFSTAKIMVGYCLIDDNAPSKSRRTNLMNTAYKKTGLGLYHDTTNSKFYLVSLHAGSYTCSKCDTITCQMQKDCGWNQYLKDAGLNDPCEVTTTSSDSVTSGTTSGSSTSDTTTSTSTSTSTSSNQTQQASSSRISLLISSLLALVCLLTTLAL